MSSLIVEVCAVEEIASHPNADRLERVRVKNWWCIAGLNQYKVGDKVVYIPPDSVLSEELAERWGIAKYCSILPKEMDGERPPGLRVRAARFRGEPSFGTLQPLDNPTWEIGLNVLDHYGITKFEPPIKVVGGDIAPDVPEFHAYTSIENIGNFPNVFKEGEEVVVDEKIHGTNCRIGVMLHPRDNGELAPTFMAGSHATRRKKYDEDKGKMCLYWTPLIGKKNMEHLLMSLFKANDKQPVIIFGEIFGQGIQDMKYGQKGKSFRAFDISIGGKYMDFDDRVKVCCEHDIEVAPFLYRGPFSMEKMNELVDGPTEVCESSDIKEPFKGREGIVIRPVQERFDPDIERTILKHISVDYHERKNKDKTENH
jgi:RNA ligase (TIGR02306 family)